MLCTTCVILLEQLLNDSLFKPGATRTHEQVRYMRSQNQPEQPNMLSHLHTGK